jgi:acyl transferase domain-containing protein
MFFSLIRSGRRLFHVSSASCKTPMTAIVCPGQGSQTVGMSADLYESLFFLVCEI